jgi:uncharacterized LabA/DUF88 family protein
MLTHAFQDHHEVAVLITSGRDYIPLINEVKHFGKQVELMFFGSAKIDPALKIARDNFDDLTNIFNVKWQFERPLV